MLKKVCVKILTSLMSNNQYIDYLRKRGVKIGTGCSVAKNAIFGSEPYLIKIGDNVRITSNVQFVTHDGGLWVLRNMGLIDKNSDKLGTISVGNNVNIGWNVVIMPNVNIGNNVVIGVGSIVTRDIPDNSVVAGVPAKVIEDIGDYCKKNKQNIVLTKGMNKKQKKEFLIKYYISREDDSNE